MFIIRYHPKVLNDFRGMHPRHAEVLREAIDTKLALNPEIYGKPLRQTLKGYRSLRIGSYRIVYVVQKKQLIVLILTAAKRDHVYKESEKRAKKLK